MANEIPEHIERINEKIKQLEAEIAPFLQQTEKLNEYRKRLKVLDWKIKEAEKNNNATLATLKNQRIKLILKLDDLEKTIQGAHFLHETGKSLSSKYKDFKSDKKEPRKSKIINNYNQVVEEHHSASKAYRYFKSKILNTEINEMAAIINAVCNLQDDNKLFVLGGRIISKNDTGFHEAFFELSKASLKEVLTFNKKKKKQFTYSEMLKCYVNYTLKRYEL